MIFNTYQLVLKVPTILSNVHSIGAEYWADLLSMRCRENCLRSHQTPPFIAQEFVLEHLQWAVQFVCRVHCFQQGNVGHVSRFQLMFGQLLNSQTTTQGWWMQKNAPSSIVKVLPCGWAPLKFFNKPSPSAGPAATTKHAAIHLLRHRQQWQHWKSARWAFPSAMPWLLVGRRQAANDLLVVWHDFKHASEMIQNLTHVM